MDSHLDQCFEDILSRQSFPYSLQTDNFCRSPLSLFDPELPPAQLASPLTVSGENLNQDQQNQSLLQLVDPYVLPDPQSHPNTAALPGPALSFSHSLDAGAEAQTLLHQPVPVEAWGQAPVVSSAPPKLALGTDASWGFEKGQCPRRQPNKN